MRAAMLTGVLLAILCVQESQQVPDDAIERTCAAYPDEPCGGGWSRISPTTCAKYFNNLHTVCESRSHCDELGGSLVSVHSKDEMLRLACLSWRATLDRQPYWIGGARTKDGISYFDGTEFNYTNWVPSSPVTEKCIESNYEGWGGWINVPCSGQKNYICIKQM